VRRNECRDAVPISPTADPQLNVRATVPTGEIGYRGWAEQASRTVLTSVRDTGNDRGRWLVGPASISNLTGGDGGAYVQLGIQPSEKWELRPGIRYDAHNAPFAGTQSQVSPRVRLNLFPSPSTSLWLYYGRLFMPTNVEELRSITSAAQAGEATVPTLPERDDFFEVGITHRLSRRPGDQAFPGFTRRALPVSMTIPFPGPRLSPR